MENGGTDTSIACVAGRRKGGSKVKINERDAPASDLLALHWLVFPLSPFPSLRTPATQANTSTVGITVMISSFCALRIF